MTRKIRESKATYGPIPGRPGQPINTGPHTVIPPLRPDKPHPTTEKSQPPRTKGSRQDD